MGAVCFYIPFRSFKKKVIHFIKAIDDPLNFSISGEHLLVQLDKYITQMRNQVKTQSDGLSFLQNKIDTITSVLKEAVIILDEKGQLLSHNSQSRKIFYLDEQKSIHYLNEMVRSPDVMEMFQECLKKKDMIIRECVFRKKNQYLKSNFKVTVVPFFHQKKGDTNIIFLFYDQTDVKESQQAHIDFVSNISHELKTPLTSIRGYVEMLIQDLSQKKFDQFENFLQILLRNCKRMNDLVNDLMNLSNLASQSHLEKKRLSTKDITSHVIEQIKSRDHQLHFFFSAPYVMANPRWVEIVLHNLVDNAVRHTSKKCDIYIRWEKMRDRVILKVRDSGEGIPEQYLQRVFERFFRMDPSRSREKGGTGVGLALVKQSMEKHGGCVRAVSPKEGGTEFICEFPNS